MKTEMKIRTGEWKTKADETPEAVCRGTRKKEGRIPDLMRAGACAFLLFLLAAGGYAGTRPVPVQMTAAPVVVSGGEEWRTDGMNFEEIVRRQESGRKAEIEMLDSVISDEKASETIKNDALAQKLNLIERMEMELSVTTLLSHMGFSQVCVICGAGQVTVILPQESAAEGDDALRIIDAAASCAQVEAKDVKIILVKK